MAASFTGLYSLLQPALRPAVVVTSGLLLTNYATNKAVGTAFVYEIEKRDQSVVLL
jgi:hypothetical protein